MKLQLPLRWIETLVVAIARARRDFNRRGTGTRSLPFKRIIFSILVLHAVRSTAILGLVLVRTCESFQSARITREQSVQPRRSNSALKLPANFSLPAERETGKSRRKKRYEAVRYEAFAPFPLRTMLHPLLMVIHHCAMDSSRRNRLSRTLYSSDPWMLLLRIGAFSVRAENFFHDPRRGQHALTVARKRLKVYCTRADFTRILLESFRFQRLFLEKRKECKRKNIIKDHFFVRRYRYWD